MNVEIQLTGSDLRKQRNVILLTYTKHLNTDAINNYLKLFLFRSFRG